MSIRAASTSYEGIFSIEAVENAARSLRGDLGGPASVAIVFMTPDYLPFLDEFSDTIRVDGHIAEIIGSTGTGVMCDAAESENQPGFSIMAIRTPDFAPQIFCQSADDLQSGTDSDWLRRHFPSADGFVLMANPFHFPADAWLNAFNTAFPKIPIVGGLASGGEHETSMAVFHNSELIDGAVLLGLGGGLQLISVVSQGCRPIGEPLPVTKAENNVLYSLGSRPAYQALEAAFESLTDTEKSSAQGNLFVGLANNEYVDEFKPGDFLIRNIIGADPNSGAVVIAGIPRIGQTIQYQLRDSTAADTDLKATIQRHWNHGKCELLGSLVFSCTGRGTRMFTDSNHDSGTLQASLGVHPSVGFFCNGEIGPVAGKNCAHAYTASIALLCTTKE